MGMFQSSHKQTKKSYVVNACIAYALGVFMVGCALFAEVEDPKSFLVSAGIMAVMGSYWLYKRYKFDDEDFNDPFNFNKNKKKN